MKKSILYIVIGFLVCALMYQCNHKEIRVMEGESHTDTVYRVEYDTLVDFKPIFITDTIIDTIVVKDASERLVTLPKRQRYYKGMYYQAWVSGYEPNLDKINLFNRIEYRTIQSYIEPKRYELYITGNGSVVNRSFVPGIGLRLKTPSRFLLGFDVNYSGGNIGYGWSLGYKLF